MTVISPRLSVFFVMLAVALILLSCESSEICRENTETPIRMGFYNEDEDTEVATIDSLSVFGVGREDSLIYNNAKNVSSVELPLNITEDTTAFVFVFPGNNDTITISYERNVTLISLGCGFVTFFDINEIDFTKNEIVNIFIENEKIRNDLNEHLKIFVPVAPVDE